MSICAQQKKKQIGEKGKSKCPHILHLFGDSEGQQNHTGCAVTSVTATLALTASEELNSMTTALDREELSKLFFFFTVL